MMMRSSQEINRISYSVTMKYLVRPGLEIRLHKVNTEHKL